MLADRVRMEGVAPSRHTASQWWCLVVSGEESGAAG